MRVSLSNNDDILCKTYIRQVSIIEYLELKVKERNSQS
jgi:hypothetical protein